MEIAHRRKHDNIWSDANALARLLRMHVAVIATGAFVVVAAAGAQAQGTALSVKKSASKAGAYADVVEVSGPAKTLFLWGTGAEDETSTTAWRPAIVHLGSFSAQCDYSMDKIGRMLTMRGAKFSDVTVIRAFLTDGRHTPDLYACLDKVYPDPATKPAVTSFNVSQLAHSGMLVELEVTAVMPDQENKGTFSIYRNNETLGKWNPGAIEIVETSGPDRTVYFSGSQAVQQKRGEAPVSMFPGDFAKQCDFLQRSLLSVTRSEGMTAGSFVRMIRFVAGYNSIPELIKCSLPGEDSLRSAASTLAYVSQLDAVGSLFLLDSVAMAPLKPTENANAFKKTVIPSELTADTPSAIAVSGPRRTINIAGLGSQDETGNIQFIGDFKAQCAASVKRIDALLKQRNSSLKDVVKLLVLVTDSRSEPDFRKCMMEAFPDGPPAQTFVNVSRLPHAGMLVQLDAIAVAAP